MGITVDEYDKKCAELKEDERKTLLEMEKHSKGDESFLITSSYVLELSKRAHELFIRSHAEQKRRLLKFVFANLEANGSKLLYKTKEPFDELLFCGQKSEWLRILEEVRTKICNRGNPIPS